MADESDGSRNRRRSSFAWKKVRDCKETKGKSTGTRVKTVGNRYSPYLNLLHQGSTLPLDLGYRSPKGVTLTTYPGDSLETKSGAETPLTFFDNRINGGIKTSLKSVASVGRFLRC